MPVPAHTAERVLCLAEGTVEQASPRRQAADRDAEGGAVDTRGEWTIFWGWFAIIFFGFSAIVSIHRLVFGHRVTVELSPRGFWDKRALLHEVPWTAVSRMSVWTRRETSALRIEIADEAMRHIKMTRIHQAVRWLSKPFGHDGIYVGCGDLDIPCSELIALFQKYLSEYNPAATDDTK